MLDTTVLGDRRYVTDGGLETDLVFHHGVQLEQFSAYPLVLDEPGRQTLRDYYAQYAVIAREAGAGLMLESPTWRASREWGALLGYDPGALGEVNRQAIDLLLRLREAFAVPGTLVSGMIGPRGDGYRRGAGVDPGEAAEYHRPQLAAFRAAGADLAGVYTLTDPGEALGVALAAADVGLPLLVSFTVETDGRLPGGTSLDEAFNFVEEGCTPIAFGVNCAHPRHLLAGLPALDEQWRQRIAVVRCNASTATHAELDEADDLDDGDPGTFAAEHVGVFEALPAVVVRGGCCGTDARHVANLWGVVLPASGS